VTLRLMPFTPYAARRRLSSCDVSKFRILRFSRRACWRRVIRLRGVSKGKRSRRPSGHPAKVAVRRERDGSGRSSAAAGPGGIARRILREALDLTGALDAEVWGSTLLGAFWCQRGTLPLEEAASDEYSLVSAIL
jgi:hypothetical protein